MVLMVVFLFYFMWFCLKSMLSCIRNVWNRFTLKRKCFKEFLEILRNVLRNFLHWLHWKLPFWQLSMQPALKISSKWRHCRFSVDRNDWPLYQETCITHLRYNTFALSHRFCFVLAAISWYDGHLSSPVSCTINIRTRQGSGGPI